MLESVVRDFFTSDTFVDDYEDGVQQFGRVLQNIEDPDIFLADLNTLLEGDTISTTTLNMASYDEFDSILVGLDRLLHIRKEGDIGPFLEHLNFDWLVSVWGGEPLDVRMLYNGRILLRNHHRVLGPDFGNATVASDPDVVRRDIEHVMALSREVGKVDAVTWLRHEPLGVQVYHVNGVFQETADHEIAVLRLGLFPEEQLEGLLQSEVASVQKGARYGIVFVRLHPGRADVIGATRYDDEFDVLLEEFSRGLFGDVLDKDGMNLAHPLSGEALENEVAASILREVEEVYGLKRFGEMMTGVVHETIIPAIMKRRLRSMQWDVPPFGFATVPDRPLSVVPLLEGIERRLAEDPSLRNRSVAVSVSLSEAVLETLQSATFAEVLYQVEDGADIRLTFDSVVGACDLDPVVHDEEMADQIANYVATLRQQMDEDPETWADGWEDFLASQTPFVHYLLSFDREIPHVRTLYELAQSLSARLETRVSLVMLPHGDYYAFDQGDVDSGDHELLSRSAEA